jgi:hypothetical protein
MAHVAIEQPENLIRVRDGVADQITDHERAALEAVDVRSPHPATMAQVLAAVRASTEHRHNRDEHRRDE